MWAWLSRVGVSLVEYSRLRDITTPAVFVAVEVIEVGNHHRYRKSNGQHAGHYTKRPHQFAPDSHGRNVTVTHGCHGNDGPPKGSRYRGQLRVRFSDFGVICGRTKNHHSDQEEEEEHAQFPERRLYGQSQYPKSLGVFAELEYSKYSQHSYENETVARRFGGADVCFSVGHEAQQHTDEVGHDGHQIHDVHHVPDEGLLAGTGHETHHEFHAEPSYAERLQHKEHLIEIDLSDGWINVFVC